MKQMYLFKNNRKRFTIFRLETDNYIYDNGWKLTISLHPKIFLWRHLFEEFFITLFGINIHFMYHYNK